MHEYLEDAFSDWTRNLDEVEKRISIFENVRDIPYMIIPELISYDVELNDFLSYNAGSCTPKHILITRMYNMLGLEVRYLNIRFRWKDLDVGYPKKLKELAGKHPDSNHMALESYINNRWTTIDASWDLPLLDYGFTVNLDWDGFMSQGFTVPLIKINVFADAKERSDYLDLTRPSLTEEQKKVNLDFYIGLNRWLDSIRKKSPDQTDRKNIFV